MARRNNKKKKKSSSSLSLILIATVVVIAVVIFTNSGGSFAGDVFAKSKSHSKNSKSVPPELRWEKAFRFNEDSGSSSGGNFLQKQAEYNKRKKEH